MKIKMKDERSISSHGVVSGHVVPTYLGTYRTLWDGAPQMVWFLEPYKARKQKAQRTRCGGGQLFRAHAICIPLVDILIRILHVVCVDD